MKKIASLICVLALATVCEAQWELDLGPGVAIPITSYNEVVKTGWLLQAGAKIRLNNRFAVGLKTQFARLQKDKNPNDAFDQTRMTITPFLVIAEYGNFLSGKLQPYLTGGLGIGFFNINYENSPTQGKSINNVSFTMMPQIGLRYPASKNVFPFIESGLILIADGPPIGFPKSDQITGYAFIAAGVLCRLK